MHITKRQARKIYADARTWRALNPRSPFLYDVLRVKAHACVLIAAHRLNNAPSDIEAKSRELVKQINATWMTQDLFHKYVPAIEGVA